VESKQGNDAYELEELIEMASYIEADQEKLLALPLSQCISYVHIASPGEGATQDSRGAARLRTGRTTTANCLRVLSVACQRMCIRGAGFGAESTHRPLDISDKSILRCILSQDKGKLFCSDITGPYSCFYNEKHI
jgi:hypothetical protein